MYRLGCRFRKNDLLCTRSVQKGLQPGARAFVARRREAAKPVGSTMEIGITGECTVGHTVHHAAWLLCRRRIIEICDPSIPRQTRASIGRETCREKVGPYV